MFCDKSYNASPCDLALFVIVILKQLNIKKIKLMEIILKKNITKNENTKETRKKSCEEKLYQFIVFCEEKLVFTSNCNS